MSWYYRRIVRPALLTAGAVAFLTSPDVHALHTWEWVVLWTPICCVWGVWQWAIVQMEQVERERRRYRERLRTGA